MQPVSTTREAVPPKPAAEAVQSEGNSPGTDSKVIYDKDDRKDCYQADKSWQERARASLTLVRSSKVKFEGDQAKLTTDDYDVCAKEPFSDQSTLGFCSAWWVGKDLVITAGHCISPGEEKQVRMVAGFQVDAKGETGPTQVPASSVYDVKKVIYSVMDSNTGEDWAIVRLSREVEQDTQPFAVSDSDTPVGAAVTMIGYPAGLPTKVAGGAKVKDANPEGYFKADLDAYGGNSGSVVVNDETGEAEGILVRGARDYVWDSADSCYVSNRIPSSTNPGEEVTKSMAFVDELRDVQAGREPQRARGPGEPLDVGEIRKALGPQVWSILRKANFEHQQPGTAPGSDAKDLGYLDQAEISALPMMFRAAIRNDKEMRGQRFVRTADAADVIMRAIVDSYDSFAESKPQGFSGGDVAAIENSDVRLLVTMAIIATHGATVFSPAQ